MHTSESPQEEETTVSDWQDVARDFHVESTIAGMIMLRLESQAAACELEALRRGPHTQQELRAVTHRATLASRAAAAAGQPFAELAARLLVEREDELSPAQSDMAEQLAENPAVVFHDLMEPVLTFLREVAGLSGLGE